MPECRPGLRPLAGPVREDAVEDVERLANLLRVRVRAEVDDAAAMPLAREHDPRVLVLDGDGDVRERLVVAEPDVERRPVALDEVLLEMERLDLGIGDDHLEVGDPLGQRRRSWGWPGSSCARAAGATSPCRCRAPRRRRRGTGRRPVSSAAPSAWARVLGPVSSRQSRVVAVTRLLLAVALAAAVGVGVWAVFLRSPDGSGA